MKIYFTNQNFKGYSDIYAGHGRNAGIDFSFLSIKTDDVNKKTRRLYKEYKELTQNKDCGISDDIITICLFEDKKNKLGDIFLNENFLYTGSELKNFHKKAKDSKNSDELKLIEKINLKAYTLIAFITKDILNRKQEVNLQKSNQKSNQLLDSMYKIFMSVSNKRVANESVCIAIKQDSNRPKKYAANNINKYIKKTMETFFK